MMLPTDLIHIAMCRFNRWEARRPRRKCLLLSALIFAVQIAILLWVL